MKLVSIITINYNQKKVTEELIESISAKNTYKNIEIIVIDNDSKDNPVPQWRIKYPYITFVYSKVNLGFAGGNNLGIKEAKGDYLFFLNNDTEITENLIDVLADTLNQHPEVGVVSPKIKYFSQPDILQYVGYTELNYFNGRNKCIGQFEKDEGQYDNLVGKTGYAHGAAMMIKRSAIEKAGLMAENFFLYYEELDWCERIKKKGFEIWVNAKACVFHKESISVGKQSALKEYYMNRNRILLVRKHAGLTKLSIFVLFFALGVIPRNLINYIRKREYKFIPLFFKATWWNLINKTDSKKLYFPPVK